MFPNGLKTILGEKGINLSGFFKLTLFLKNINKMILKKEVKKHE